MVSYGSIDYEFNMGDQVGNKIIREMKTGINYLILQALVSLRETGFTWQSTQLDLGTNEYQCELKCRQ